MAINLNGTTGITTTGLTSNGIDDNATSTAMTLDTSGNVGIGTSSPSQTVHLSNASTAYYLAETTGTGTSAGLRVKGGASADYTLFTTQGTNQFAIYDNAVGTERMRIDSSGNLLVGQSSSTQPGVGNTTNGFAIRNDGLFFSSAYQGRTGTFGRNGNDGPILGFYKDGSTVGSIGTLFGDLYAATGNTGIRFVDANRSVSPYDSNASALVDAAVDLGYASARYKDLYLSGGVYLGGTGSANKLDDYEEGTWTPGIRFGASTAGSLTSVGGSYTKIGRQVTVNVAFSVSNLNGGSGAAYVTGFPFTAADTVANTSIEGQGLVGYYSDIGESVSGMGVGVLQNGTVAEVYKYSSSTVSNVATQTTLQVGADIRFSLTYFTA